MKNSEKNFGWFYGKNGSVNNVVSKPFSMAEYNAEKANKIKAAVVKAFSYSNDLKKAS